MRKRMRGATRRQYSTVGVHSDAGQRTKENPALLDPREDRFATLYAANPNGTQAAVAAGYSPKSAHTIAHRLLKRSKIRDAIARRNAELMVELDFSPQRIVREIAMIAGVNLGNFVRIDNEGNPHIDLNGVKRHHLAAVCAVEGPIIEDGRVVKAPKIRVHDKLRALDMLAKIAALYPADRHELSGPNGGPIEHEHRIDIESLGDEDRQKLRSVLLALKRQAEVETSSKD
jgi:phage terminase small subunit